MNRKSGALCALISVAPLAVLHGQLSPGTMLWSYDTGSSIWTSPAVGSDGTVYVGTSAGLCAITNNGIVASNKWTFSPAFAYFGSPSIGMDGTIYSGDADGNLYA